MLMKDTEDLKKDMVMRILRFNYFIFILFFVCQLYSDSMILKVENDLFAQRDFDYTHGTKITYQIEKENIINSFSIFQFIYTPEKINVAELQEDNRPWAGWGGFEFVKTYIKEKRYNNIGFNIGMVGPSSFSENSQKIVHKIVGATTPLGWDNQIEDTFALNFIYEMGFILYHNKNFSLSSSTGTLIGTTHIIFDANISTKLGYNVPLDYTKQTIEPFFLKNSYFLLGKITSRRVLYNATIDRASYASSEPLVFEGALGVGIIINNWEISYSYVWRTSEYKDDLNFVQPFGNVMIKYDF